MKYKPLPTGFRAFGAAFLVVALAGCAALNPQAKSDTPASAAEDASTSPKPAASGTAAQPKPFAEVIKDARRSEGFFTVWQKEEKLWLEIRPDQLDKPFHLSTVLSKGLAQAPFVPGLLGDAHVARFCRIGNQVLLLAVNTGFRAPEGSPLQHAVNAVSDSLLGSVAVASADDPERKSFLVDANALLLSDMAGVATLIETAFRLPYALDRANSSIERVRVSSERTAVAVSLHYSVPKLPAPSTPPAAGTPKPAPPRAIPDPRSFFLGIQYRLQPLPELPMPIRLADERVGYFVSEYRDLAADYSKDTRTRFIDRWRLEKMDAEAPVTEPKQPIVAYLDRNIPPDLRPAVEAGVLEWNKAFEQAGFRNALVVRQQPDDADWDVLEGRHLAVKWFVDSATSSTSAIGPRQVDPRTGEILHAAALIPELWARFSGSRFGEVLPPRVQEGPGPQAHRHGPGELCTFAFDALEQASFAFELMASRGQLVRDSAEARDFVATSIKKVVMHEVGHALGLRHNFKASTAFGREQLQDHGFTSENGLSASIMDYVPENIPAEGDRQFGVVLMNTIGEYDRWAIEYGYRQFSPADEAQQLQQLAARSATDPGLAYATDEDAGGDDRITGVPPGIDPLANRFDLGADPLAYFRRQLKLVRELWQRTQTRKLDADEDYRIYRRNLERGLAQIGSTAPGIAKYLGGIYVNRDRAGSGRPLLTPVETARQREALDLLAREVLASDSFRFDPQFMRRLGIDQFARYDGGMHSPDFSLPEAVARIQRSTLDQLMSEALAQRLADAEAKVADPSALLTYADVQATLADAVWSELASGRDVDSLRRNLQREHLRRLASALLRATPAAATDVRPVNRIEAQRLQARLTQALKNGRLNAATRAHLSESLASLQEALAAPMWRQNV